MLMEKRKAREGMGIVGLSKKFFIKSRRLGNPVDPVKISNSGTRMTEDVTCCPDVAF